MEAQIFKEIIKKCSKTEDVIIEIWNALTMSNTMSNNNRYKSSDTIIILNKVDRQLLDTF